MRGIDLLKVYALMSLTRPREAGETEWMRVRVIPQRVSEDICFTSFDGL